MAASAPVRPTISVITPSFNQGRFIERCIRSVLSQNYPNCEHIVYDNCSTDETLAVLRRFPHVDWVSEPDRGQSEALNKALGKARGDIIAWLNADDYYLPGAFDVVARELRPETGTVIVLGRTDIVGPDGRVLKTTAPHYEGHEYLVDAWSHDHGLASPGMFIRRAALQRVGLFDPTLHYAMDYDLWLRLTKHFPIKIVDEVLAGFVVHPASKSGQARHMAGFRQEAERVSRRYWGSPLTRRYWRLQRACNRRTAELLVHAIVDSHKHDARLQWPLVWELLRRSPARLGQRHILAVLGERMGPGWLWRQTAPAWDRAGDGLGSPPDALANGRVTVVIPTYNRAELVQRAIRSALAQTAADLCDVVVVDDGSTDDTPAVVRRFGAAVRHLRQRNAGVSAARNAGLRNCRNEFVAFLDSDDEWAPDKIAQQLAALRRHPQAVFVACQGGRRASSGAEWSPDMPDIACDQPIDLAPHLFAGLFLLTSGVMVRTRLLGGATPFRTSLPMCEDYLLWLQLACRGPAIVLANRLVTCGWNEPFSLAADAERVTRAQLCARYMVRHELCWRPDCRGMWRAGLARLLAGRRDAAFRAGRYPLAACLGFRSLMVQPGGRARWEWRRFAEALFRSLVS